MSTAFANQPGLMQHDAIDTTVDAAKSIIPRSGTMRREVYDHLASCPDGATFDEIQDALGKTYSSVGPRVRELKDKGLAKDSGRRRLGHAGQPQVVWITCTPQPEEPAAPAEPVRPTTRALPRLPAERPSRVDLVEQIISCTGCALAEQCSGPVPFHGPNPCSVAIIGEAPDQEEDRKGQPFCGPAGQMIRKHLRAVDVDPETCFWLNTVSCWPQGTPDDSHITACRGNREAQLVLADPTWVLLLGGISLKAHRPGLTIFKARGRPFKPYEGGPVFYAAVHPAAALRNGAYEKALEEDLQRFAKMVGDGIESWQKHIPDTCWDCGSGPVVWVDPDFTLWCSKHAPSAYRDRFDYVDLEYRAALHRLARPEQGVLC